MSSMHTDSIIINTAVLQEIRRGADVTKPDSKGRTALHFAATRGDTNMGMQEVIWRDG